MHIKLRLRDVIVINKKDESGKADNRDNTKFY